jgi:hypothetical protein
MVISLKIVFTIILKILGSGGFSAASAIQQDDPIVESVPDAEHLTSTLIIAGGEGYIDFRSGKYNINNNLIFKIERFVGKEMSKMFCL